MAQPSGTACGTGSCNNGTATAPGRCDGSGRCQPGERTACAPYTQCAGTVCATTWATDDDCAAGSFCNGEQHCVGDGPDGEACAHAGQCQSGFCVNGVCCNSACDGACVACDMAGRLGTCSDLCGGSGCRNGDTCVDGTSDTACGRNGEACQSCSGTGVICGGGGTSGVCGCTPLSTCPALLDCGESADGCGGTIPCRACCGFATFGSTARSTTPARVGNLVSRW